MNRQESGEGRPQPDPHRNRNQETKKIEVYPVEVLRPHRTPPPPLSVILFQVVSQSDTESLTIGDGQKNIITGTSERDFRNQAGINQDENPRFTTIICTNLTSKNPITDPSEVDFPVFRNFQNFDISRTESGLCY